MELYIVRHGIADELGYIRSVCHCQRLDRRPAGAWIAAVEAALEHFDRPIRIQPGKDLGDFRSSRPVQVGLPESCLDLTGYAFRERLQPSGRCRAHHM